MTLMSSDTEAVKVLLVQRLWLCQLPIFLC